MRPFRGWSIVAAAALGCGFSATIFVATGYSILSAGISSAQGWSLREMSIAVSLFLTTQAIGYPLVGWFLDRFGTRRVVQFGIVAFGLHLVALSRIDAVWQLYALMTSMGAISAATFTVPYFRALSRWFIRRRGMALGFAASGIAIGAVCFPLAMQKIIAAAGWSQSVLAVAALQLLVCLPVVTWLVRDDPAQCGLLPDGTRSSNDAQGLPLRQAKAEQPGDATIRQALRTRDFWLLAVIFWIAGVGTYVVQPNLVHFLSNGAGLSMQQIAVAQAFGGLFTFFGRIFGGIVLDRINPVVLGVATNLGLALSMVGLAVGSEFWFILCCAALFGASIGGELDVLPYISAKRWGVTHIGLIYGVLAGVYGFGSACGPVFYAEASVRMASPTAPLLVVAVFLVFGAGLFCLFGRRRG